MQYFSEYLSFSISTEPQIFLPISSTRISIIWAALVLKIHLTIQHKWKIILIQFKPKVNLLYLKNNPSNYRNESISNTSLWELLEILKSISVNIIKSKQKISTNKIFIKAYPKHNRNFKLKNNNYQINSIKINVLAHGITLINQEKNIIT